MVDPVLCWLALLALLSFLMVCTWRYPSFKGVNLARPRSPLTVILFGALIYLIWILPQPVLLALASAYVASGIVMRVGGHRARRFRHSPASGASSWLNLPVIRVAVVGGDSLLGKEIREAGAIIVCPPRSS